MNFIDVNGLGKPQESIRSSVQLVGSKIADAQKGNKMEERYVM